MTDPDRIRTDIERTRMNLSDDVDALTEKVSPSRIVGRRVDRARGAMRSVRETVMGSSSHGQHAASPVRDTASSVGDRVSSAASSVGDAASSAPRAVRRQATGNPLAAGVIAFGIGALVSSLLPASQKEREMAGEVKDTLSEHSDQIKQEVKGAAREFADNLRGPSQDAVQSVRDTATEGAATVKDESRAAAQDVQGQAWQSAHQVSNS